MRLVAMCLLALAAAWSDAAAESLSNLSVPGGRSGLSRILKVPDTTERALLVLEVTRAVYDAPWGSAETFAARLPELDRYLDAIDVVEDDIARDFPGGTVNLQALARGQSDDVLKGLGVALRRGASPALEPATGQEAEHRRELLLGAGLHVDDLIVRLNAGESVRIVLPAEVVPLPLTPAKWSEVVFKRSVPPGSLFGAIVRDRRAALLYYGLSALDQPTLEYVSAHPDIVSRIYRESAAAFSTFARSVYVRDGRIAPPGGSAAAPLWEAVVGESVSAPARFLAKLLERDEGRLAFFYDTVAHLDAVGVRLALGRSGADQKNQFAALAKVFVEVDPVWRIEQRPFARNPYDPAMLLNALLVSAEGVLAPPNQRRFWTTVFESDQLPAVGVPLPDLAADGPADAAWIADRVCLAEAGTRADRFESVLFAQRVFAEAADSDAPSVLTAIRGYPRYRALLLTLERIGIRNAAVYASAVRAASRLSDVGEPARRAIGFAAFQGALTVVERARFARTIDVPTASALIQTLSESPSDGWKTPGGIGGWVNGHLLPAMRVGKPVDPSTGVESVMFAALAGPRPDRSRLIHWEDMTYHLDRPAAVLSRLRQARAIAGGSELDAVFELWRQVSAIAAEREPVRGLKSAADSLKTAAEALIDVPAIGRVRVESTQAPIADAIADASRLNPSDGSRAGDILEKLEAALETLWADALLRLAYIATIGSLGTDVSNVRELVAFHDFGFGEVGERGVRAPWQVPQEVTGSGLPSHVMGSLLALDLGLAPLALRRMGAEPPDQAPTLNQNDTQTFIENVVMINPMDLTDEGGEAIATAIDAGRARIAELQRDPSTAPAIEPHIQLSEWRVRVLPWMAVNEPEHVQDLFSLGELFWLGRPSPAGAASLDAWGTPGIRSGECVCTRLPEAQAWENYSGRPMTGQLAAHMPDLTLRIAVTLARRKLPAALARDVMALATRDLVDGAQLAYPDDWLGMVRYVRSVPEDQFDDYISSVAADGPLVPVPGARPPSPQ